MSNRMSVLSRRLERFAVVFSIATFAFFLLGFFASAKTEDHLLFLAAGLASVCLFAAFFLWLAHGFAWALIPEEPVEARKYAPTWKPAQAVTPLEERPAEAIKATESKRPAEPVRPPEPIELAEPVRPAEPIRPKETIKPAETIEAAQEKNPVEEKEILQEDPPDAKYTITGKRIY